MSVLAIISLLLTLTGPAAAAASPEPLSDGDAIRLLQDYGILKGDGSGSLLVTEPLSRAQAAALFIRSMGVDASLLPPGGPVPFTDARDHWAAREITLVERLGLMRGDGGGSFRPDAKISYAEFLTVLLRMVKLEPEGPWNPAVILSTADMLGIAPTRVDPSEPAIRGKIFSPLATAISRVPLENGETLLQTYVDRQPPELSLDQQSLTTAAGSLTITGRAIGASSVLVNGEPASLRTSTGLFSYTASLDTGANLFLVEAYDLAGNKAAATLRAERNPTVARITISGPAYLKAGTKTAITIVATTPDGVTVPLSELETEMTGGVATFDSARGTIVVGSTPGHGTLSVRADKVVQTYEFDVVAPSAAAQDLVIASINDGRAPATGQKATVEVQVVDADGALATDDYYRNVTLSSSGLTGITVSPSTAQTVAGIATFTVTGTREGLASLTARSTGLGDAVTAVEFLSSIRVVLTASPASLKPDGLSTTTIRASLQDQNGKAVSNTSGSEIVVGIIAENGDGVLTKSQVTIRKGYSNSSGYDAAFKAGVTPGTVKLSGELLSSHTYSVQSLSIPMDAALPGVKLQVVGTTAKQTPDSSNTSLTVRVLDANGRLVTTGWYAFRLSVSTSNGEDRSNGLPEGVSLTFPNSSLRPVDDGLSDSDPNADGLSVIGRTHQGTATVVLRYNKSGVVTVTPELVGAQDDAYHPTSGYGAASPSTGMQAQGAQITYAGTAAAVQLAADSAIGKDLMGGSAGLGTAMTLRARVVDAQGAAIPGYTGDVSLKTTSGTGASSITGVNHKAATNGIAEFTVTASSSAGYEQYVAVAGTLTSAPLTVSVRSEKPATPQIAAIRGRTVGDLSPTLGYVGPDADYMDIQLQPQGLPSTGEPHYWVSAKVFRKGETSPVMSGELIDLASDLPVIRVPVKSLKPGRATYEVTINNGTGDTARSPDLGLSQALTSVYNSTYKLLSAYFDAETGRLALGVSGLASNGIVDPGKIRITKGLQTVSLADPSASVLSVSSTQVLLQLGSKVADLDPDLFSGSVFVEADQGWYTSADGSLIAHAVADAQVKPMATITSASLDVSGRRLILNGSGLTQGTISLNLLKFEDATGTSVALKPGTTSTTDRIASTGDGQVVISLSAVTATSLSALVGPDLFLTAQTGWLRTTYGGQTYRTGALTGATRPVYMQVSVTSAQYNRTDNTLTLSGSGFTGATVDPTRFRFRASGQSQVWISTDATATVGSDGASLVIQLTSADGAAFETRFSGRSIFLNAEAGWIRDQHNRAGAPIPENSLLFGVPTQ